ncbi:hypothetical protein ACVW0I_005908 [Bradyrhizobium sp. LM6.11]
MARGRVWHHRLTLADAATVGGSDQAAQHFNKPGTLGLRSYGDAQEVLDARLSEMPDQNATLAKRCRKICSAPASMARENEVCERRQHLEAELSKLAGQRFAARDDTGAGLAKPAVVLDRGDGAGDSEAIDGIGVEAVLHAFQRFDQRSLTDGKTNPQASERARFREGLDDQQIVVACNQRHGSLSAPKST